jgi:hypothetical protein
MAWGSVTTTDGDTLTTSWSTLQVSSADYEQALNPRELAHVQIAQTTSGSADTYWAVQSSPDGGTTWDGDTTPLMQGFIDYSEVAGDKISFIVTGVKMFRLRAKCSTGTTAVITAKVVVDGVNAT